MLLMLTAVAAAACERPTDAGTLAVAMGRAEKAYAALELEAFRAGHAAAGVAIPCLDAPVPATAAAAWHRLEALAAVTRDDWSQVSASFRSALAVEPGWVPSEDLAPSGNPIRERYDAARLLGPGRSRRWVAPGGVVLWVDGSPSRDVPVERPYVAQLVNREGVATLTEALPTGGLPSVPEGRRGPNVPLALGAAGAGLGAAAIYAVALGTRAEFDDPATPYDELDGLEATTNSTALAAAGVGTVAVGLGVASFVVRW